MKISRAVAVTATLSLAACGSGTQPGPPSSTASREAAPTAAPATDEVPILALGDSLFAGYGLKDGESYPAQLERALRERGINARIANAGVSGNTTADGLQRLIFTLDNQPRRPALAIVSLGGNDMLRGLKPEQAKANLDAILTEFDRRHIPCRADGPARAAEHGRRLCAGVQRALSGTRHQAPCGAGAVFPRGRSRSARAGAAGSHSSDGARDRGYRRGNGGSGRGRG